jgi:hypothetical protein
MPLLDVWGERVEISGMMPDQRRDGTRYYLTVPKGSAAELVARLPGGWRPMWIKFPDGKGYARCYFHAVIIEIVDHWSRQDDATIVLMMNSKPWWKYYDGESEAAGKQYRAISGELVR